MEYTKEEITAKRQKLNERYVKKMEWTILNLTNIFQEFHNDKAEIISELKELVEKEKEIKE